MEDVRFYETYNKHRMEVFGYSENESKHHAFLGNIWLFSGENRLFSSAPGQGLNSEQLEIISNKLKKLNNQ